MTDRVWTLDKLAEVHPLPHGWAWGQTNANGVPTWCARLDDEDECEVSCFVWPNGNTVNDAAEAPIAVLLAVILASKGLDSFEAMADALDGKAKSARLAGLAAHKSSKRASGYREEGKWASLHEVAAMLRRGRVDE